MTRGNDFQFESWARLVVAAAVMLLLGTVPAFADGGVTFTDIADGGGAGITYSRTPSPRVAIKDAIVAFSGAGNMTIPGFFLARANSPQKAAGAPGVAILDYDGDGDQDIYVPNGPGSANSLYSNQLIPSGTLSFVDVGVASGADATAQDSTGVCYGDVDNDGDQDLYVVSSGVGNILFKNNGDGTFTDVTDAATAGPTPYRYGIACSMADFDGNGFLDIVVANTYRGCSNPVNPFTGQQYPCSFTGDPNDPPQSGWEQRLAVFSSAFVVFPEMEHNVILMNQDGSTFVDNSAASGIENVSILSAFGTGAAFNWAIASYDIDGDGDVDIHSADNQGSSAVAAGLNRIYLNDGNGNFTDSTAALGLDTDVGGWMGVAAADYNCDQRMDFFGTDLGTYLASPAASSRWFLQNPDGTFDDPGVGALNGTPFGWGTSALDYDNDGDQDIIYHGSVDILNLIVADNPGVLLQNTGSCSAIFDWDSGAVLKNHNLRIVEGVAVGDLNNDGFEDIVSVSDADVDPGNPNFLPYTLITGPIGPFDATARFQNVLTSRIVPGRLVPVVPFPTLSGGTLSVEINSADNGNGWVAFNLVGSAGIVPGGTINRAGIGATVRFTPDGGPTSSKPVHGGASYGSQDSLVAHFGLGAAAQGTVDVVWPGGFKNRLYDVADGETVTLPALPCSYDAAWPNFGTYNDCVMSTLEFYKDAGIINAAQKNRIRDSARRAFDESQ